MAEHSVGHSGWLRTLICVCCMALCQGQGDSLRAQEPSPAKPPRIALISPLGVLPGVKTRVILRGWLLKDPVAVVADRSEVQIAVVSHAAAAVPGRQKAEQIGDEQLELDIEVPAGFTADAVTVSVRTAGGDSAGRRLLIGSVLPLIQEQEPNDGFRQTQQISVPQLIVGSIHADTNVDVYSFELTQATAIRIQVDAASLGSNLDSMLTLWTASGTIVASSDDGSGTVLSRDSVIESALPAGRYLITLQDALDRGGPAHPYRLQIQQLPASSQLPTP